MSDYISREAAKQILSVLLVKDAAECACNLIDSVFPADVEPVVHGRWECVYDDSTGETDITCSHCKNTRTVNGCFVSTDGKSCYFEDDYCPSCGAKMDLEDETNDN